MSSSPTWCCRGSTGWGWQAACGAGPRALEAGFDHFLLKPAEPDSVRALLRGLAEEEAPRPPGPRGPGAGIRW